MTDARRVVRTAEHWWVRASEGRLVVHRPADDTWLEAEGNEAAVRRLARGLNRGIAEDELPDRARRAFGRQGAGVCRALREHAVLRSVGPPGAPRIRGRGPLADAARWLARRGGWRLPAVDCPGRLRAGSAPLTALAVGAVVVLVGREACPGCAALRALARLAPALPRGDVRRPSAPGRRLARALLAETWQAAQAEPLGPHEAIAVARGEGCRRGRPLPHADCPVCGPGGAVVGGAVIGDAVVEAIDGARRALARRRGASTLELAVAEDPLGPMEIHTVPGPAGRYPLDVPFIWGSLHLVRCHAGRVVGRSTLGGIYANAPEPATGRLLAVSEGVERHELRAARPHGWLPASATHGLGGLPVVDRVTLGSGRRPPARLRRLPYCAALDLTAGTGALVPYEAVAVDPPVALAPDGLRRDPFYTGGASHQTLREAVVHGTVELLGRDAFVISWYRRRSLRRLVLPRRPPAEIRRRLGYLDEHGIDVELFDLTLEAPLPMVLLRLVARRRAGNWPRGGALLVPAAGFTPREALRHALKLGCAQCVSLVVHPDPAKDPLDPAAVRALARSVPFWPLLARYLDPAHAEAHAFLPGPGQARLDELPGHDLATAGARYQHLVRWFRRAGYRWLAVRVTGAVARAVGLEVCRVIVPGFVALAPSRRATDLDLPRMHADWPGARPGLHRAPHPIY